MKRSIVFRGVLSYPKRPTNHAKTIIDSVRKWFDDEIIIITWKHQRDHLVGINNVDKIIMLDDPGEGPIQQTLRQMLHFNIAMNYCHGDQIMVTRMDIKHDKNLFDYLDGDQYKTKINLSCFQKKLLVSSMLTIRPEYPHDTFRVCDWYHVGYKEDIHRWASALDVLNETDPNYLISLRNEGKICTEQIWFGFVYKKYKDPSFDWTDTHLYGHLNWNLLLDNFIIKNTRSTAESFNLNWNHQPEFKPDYVDENIIELKKLELC